MLQTSNIQKFSRWLYKNFSAAVLWSLSTHLFIYLGLALHSRASSHEKLKYESVKVQVNEITKPPSEPPPRPKKVPRKKAPPPSKPPSHKITEKAPPPAKNVAPVQGLSKESVSADGKGIKAPVGNTMMTADEGKRLNPDEVEAYQADLSRDAALVVGSFEIPEYTAEALDANLQGRFVIDVFVDETGAVVEAELRKPIGFGMDQPLLQAAEAARFRPRLNRLGSPLPGWAEIPIRLIIP